MPFPETPGWVWLGTLIILLPVGLLLLLMVADFRKRRPLKSVALGDTTIELWVRENRLPATADAILVPVAPDLAMVAGIAKWVRDTTANAVQYEAQRAAPLPPGEAFVGSGGKYRYQIAALAVVMDEQKRTKPEWIRDAICRAMRLACEQDAQTCLLPDMTQDLLRQPQTITEEQRRETCEPIARATIEGILAAEGAMEVVKLWVWRKGVEDIYLRELERLEASEKGLARAEKLVTSATH